MPNTRIAAAGTFSVSSGPAAVGNVIAFTNSTIVATVSRLALDPKGM